MPSLAASVATNTRVFLLFLKVRVEINRPNRVPMRIAPRRGKYFLLFKKFTFKE